jgi:hypothetical protein
MRRALLLLTIAAVMGAQDIRSARDDAYREWRQSDRNLEKDAANGDPATDKRAEAAAAAAARYSAARIASLTNLRGNLDREKNTAVPFEMPVDTQSARQASEAVIRSQTNAVNAGLAAIGPEPDSALQRLRTALERERTVLNTLTESISQEQKASGEIAQTASAAEAARLKLTARFQNLIAMLDEAVQSESEQEVAWAEYYRQLAGGTRSGGAAVSQFSSPPPSPQPQALASAPSATSRPITPLPRSRYVGGWTYVKTAGTFHGPEPETAELNVTESNGQVSGYLSVRFKTAPGIPTNREVQFNFSGPFQPERNQVFALETPEGAKGRIELIPTNVFNLLEINFALDPAPGKISQADFVLLKK